MCIRDRGDAPIASLATLTDDTLHPATGVEAMIAAFDAASADELAVVDDGLSLIHI